MEGEVSPSEFWAMPILQALHLHPPQIVLGEGTGLTSLHWDAVLEAFLR